MTTHKPTDKRKPGGRVSPEPLPPLKPLKPGSECSTPDRASETVRGAVSALRKLGRRRKDGAGDDPPEAA